MPTYEYACTSCGRRFDVVQSFSDAPLETCDVCGGHLKRVFHPVGIVLKGSGFYSTDNRAGRPSSKEPASKEPAKASGESKDAASKTESTHEKKTETKTKSTGDTAKPAEKKTGS